MVFFFLCASNREFALTAALHFALLAGLDDFPIAHALGVLGVMVLKEEVNDPTSSFCFPFKLSTSSLHGDMLREGMSMYPLLSWSLYME